MKQKKALNGSEKSSRVNLCCSSNKQTEKVGADAPEDILPQNQPEEKAEQPQLQMGNELKSKKRRSLSLPWKWRSSKNSAAAATSGNSDNTDTKIESFVAEQPVLKVSESVDAQLVVRDDRYIVSYVVV